MTDGPLDNDYQSDNCASLRLLHQRLRNRIMEALLCLIDGEETARLCGVNDYFENFYDFVPHRRHRDMFPNTALTPEERALIKAVSAIMDEACDAMPCPLTPDKLIATGWPARIRPLAQAALDLMCARGRFDEDREEDVPSHPGYWYH